MTRVQILILLAAVSVEVGRQITNMGQWADGMQPAFVGAAFVNVGLQVIGILSKPPARGQD